MSLNPTYQSLVDLVGHEAAAKLQAACGGQQLYIPAQPSKSAEASTARMPALRISGTFSAQVPLGDAVLTAAVAILCMRRLGVDGLVVEVETRGLGDAYLYRMADVLAPLGIQVKPLL